MQLRKSLFWDTDYDNIDWEYNAPYVVDRMMHYGVWEEFKSMLEYYGRQRVIDIVKNIRYMDPCDDILPRICRYSTRRNPMLQNKAADEATLELLKKMRR